MDKAIIYPRVSSAKQEDGASLGDQEKAGRAYCNRMGYAVAAVIRDVQTGYDSLDVRDGLRKARDMIQRGEANVLVVWRYDRATRDITDALLLHREVTEAGGRLESATEERLEDTPMGKVMLALKGFQGESEREAIIARTQQGTRSRAESGKPLIGNAPKFGYRFVGEKKDAYTIDEEAAAVVKRLYDMAYQGMALHHIATVFNTEGVLTPTQRRSPTTKTVGWRRQTIYQLLCDTAYKGQLVVYRNRVTKQRIQDEQGRTRIRRVRRLRAEEDSLRLIQPIPAIVSEDVWETVQRNIAERALRYTREGGTPNTALLVGGFVYCGHCGAKVTTNSRPNGKRAYCCQRRSSLVGKTANACPGGNYSLRTWMVDKDIWAKVVEMGGDLDHLRRMVKQKQEGVLRNLANVERDTATIEQEIASYTQQKERLARRMATEEDEHIYATLREQHMRIVDMLKQLEVRKARIHDREKHAGMWLAAFEDVFKLLSQSERKRQEGGTVLTVMSRENERQVLRALGVRVYAYANDPNAPTHHPRTQQNTRWELTIQPIGGVVESNHDR